MSIKHDSTFFITGTDTEVGKTTVSLALLKTFNTRRYKTLALKPIASGCQNSANSLHNDDALALNAMASVTLPYTTVNPFAFKPAIAPHIAAAQIGKSLTAASIKQAIEVGLQHSLADLALVEGAGGWTTPLNMRESYADVVVALQLKVILVVGMRLGCLNHALLSLKMMQAQGANCIGWIANCIEPNMPVLEDNINTLGNILDVPYLARLDYCTDPYNPPLLDIKLP